MPCRNKAHALILIVTALVSASCSSGDRVKNGAATDEGIAAIALPEDQLRMMLGQVVMGSQSGAMALDALGLDKGCDVFDRARDEAVERHLPQWRANLVEAYRSNIPAEDLAAAVAASPRAAQRQLANHLPAVGAAMQRVSMPLLKTASVEVIAEMSDEAAKVDQTGVNQTERQKDLDRMKSERSVCGVGKTSGEV